MLSLEGLTILDLSGGYPGALTTQILGDHGAEVINIEGRPPMAGKQGGMASTEARKTVVYQMANRNKKSIILNLKTEEGRAIFHRLAEKADVIVDPFRPGVSKRLGIDYDTINKVNPRIIYCAMTGYGQDGPYSNMTGHDINYISLAGALGLIGEADRLPVVPLNLLADIAGAALHATIGILIALMARANTGKGQFVDISYTDSVVSLLTFVASNFFRTDVVPKRGSVMGPPSPCYGMYETKDGRLITIGCLEPWLWVNLCRALGREEYIPFDMPRGRLADPADNAKLEEISTELKRIFLTKTRDEWFEFLRQQDVPVGKVYSMDEVFNDPQILHRKMVIEVEHPADGKIRQLGVAIKLSDTPGEVRSLPPVSGQHTDETLMNLGYSVQEIGELRRKGVIN